MKKKNWHKYCDISRINIKRTEKRNKNFKWYHKCFCMVFTPRYVYQHGIELINEKGETKDVWEKLK